MKQYLEMLKHITREGNWRDDRTGTGTQSVFGYQFRHNLQDGFPLLTTKKMAWKSIVVELLWFLKGDTNIKYLLENGCHIWSYDAFRHYMAKRSGWKGMPDTIEQFEECVLENKNGFGDKWGNLGPIYGAQWRQWCDTVDSTNNIPPIIKDQIKEVIESIRSNPDGRRHIVTAWNPSEIDDMVLPPCHCLFQFYVHDGKLSCHMYQRSADAFLGVPFNIASYALLTHIIAHQTYLDVGDLIISFGDLHIYNNHRNQVFEQVNRQPKKLPKLIIDTQYQAIYDPGEYHYTDFILEGYDPHPTIKGELSVGT